MVTATMSGTTYSFDDGSDDWTRIFHIHNDSVNPDDSCYQKLLKLLDANQG